MPSIAYDRVINGPWTVLTYDELGNGLNDPPGTGTGEISHNVMSRQWVRTPGFKAGKRGKTIRRLDLPMNAFSFAKLAINNPCSGYDRFERYPGDENKDRLDTTIVRGAYKGFGDAPNLVPGTSSGPPLPAIDEDALLAQAGSRSLLELKDQKVNLVQAFAERKQTARLLTQTITRAATAVTALKAGSFGAAASALGVKASPRRIRKWTKSWHENQSKAIANGWLELQYGWRPLLQDIYGSAELLAQKNLREVRSRIQKSASKTIREITEVPSVNIHPAAYYQVTRSVTYKYVIYYSTPSESHTLAQVGITNPALIAWELTPWSFVVDWLLPVGNYISGLDATQGLTFEKGCLTRFEKVTVFGKCRSGVTQNGLVTFHFGGESGNYLAVQCSRTPISAFPRNQLPRFKNPFSTEHVANALALLRTSFTVR